MSKKTTTKAGLKVKTASQKFHEELNAIKDQLPEGWRTKFMLANNDYNSYQGGVLINNVMSGKSTDTVLLDFLKKLVAKSKAKKNA